MHEALYFHKMGNGKVGCDLCPHHCRLDDQEIGRCRARQNHAGSLYSMNYAEISSLALDPIEKKPLYRFYPGSTVLSAGSFGCNLRCSYCQNWEISQVRPQSRTLSSIELADLTQRYALEVPSCIGAAYTYSEPLVCYEYVLESAKELKNRGLKNVLVTNGFVETKPLEELLPYIDAVNLDIKAFKPRFYQDLCQGRLEPVLKNVRLIAGICHLEVTTLIIPDENDDLTEIAELASFLAEIDPNIPLHLTRYFPNYRMNTSPPTKESLEAAQQVASKFLKFVYLGNC